MIEGQEPDVPSVFNHVPVMFLLVIGRFERLWSFTTLSFTPPLEGRNIIIVKIFPWFGWYLCWTALRGFCLRHILILLIYYIKAQQVLSSSFNEHNQFPLHLGFTTMVYHWQSFPSVSYVDSLFIFVFISKFFFHIEPNKQISLWDLS